MVNQTVQQQVIEEAQETFGGDVIVYVGQLRGGARHEQSGVFAAKA